MKILSIGNSFSSDATRYLHALAASADYPLKSVNLYIGGCSLRTHYLNMLEDRRAYLFEFNGESTALHVSIRDALTSDEWDVVTMQQASPLSPDYESYQPYLTELSRYVRLYCPHARQFLHQTWAYEEGAERIATAAHCRNAADMLEKIRASYAQAAGEIEADGVIPCGEAMMRAIENGIERIHRDTFHASLGVGRFLLALTWYGYLSGKPVDQVPFSAFDVPVSPQERAIAVRSVQETLGQ